MVGWSVFLAGFALLGMLGVWGIVTARDASDSNPAGDEQTAVAGAVATGDTVTVDVELGELYIKPSSVEVPAGATLILNVTNAGGAPHDVMKDGTEGTELLDPGASQTVQFANMQQDAQFWCTVPGHKQAGMTLDIKVIGGDAPQAVAGAHATHDTAAAATTDFATIDPNATPGADWKPFDPELQPAPGGTNHEVTWDMTEIEMEVAPGVTQQVWTFDNQVPGPVLRGKVGDIFTITIVNKGTMGHSIDFHASKVAPNVEMRTIMPGESLVYQFEAKYSGIFMYHCGTAPALHHIGNGMFGALIIDPPNLPAVDHEYVFIQSEWYLGPEGQPGDLTKMQNEDFDAVVFNGYYNQYMHAPIRVEPNERIRAWVLDAGPSENSSFHIVGTIFDTVYKEGAYTLQPDETHGGAQALDLQPAQGGFVEFTFDDPGIYTMVTHKFSNVGKGAVGTFQAGEPDAAPMSH
jgi:nitrite reductase (NO-forming)